MQKLINRYRNFNIIHSILYILIASSHILIYLHIFWITKTISDIYYLIICLIVSFGIIPIILALLVTLKKLNKNNYKILKIILKNISLIIFLLIILSSISLSENSKELSIMFYICPFYYDINDIDIIFDNYQLENNKKIIDKCKNRRCFINDCSKSVYNYLCNFDYTDNKKFCENFSIKEDTISDKLINYFDYCDDYVDFYNCIKPNNEYKKKINNYDYICPSNSDLLFNIYMIYVFLFIDIIFLCFPLLFEIAFIEDILNSFSERENNSNFQNNNSLKDTNNTSAIHNENNNEPNENSFQRQPTETIIVENKDIKDIDYVKKDKSLDILIINKNKIISNDIKNKNNDKINNNEKNKSKSDIQLIENSNNNNIFTIINKNKNNKK